MPLTDIFGVRVFTSPRVCSIVQSISPMPYTPIARTRKPMPCKNPLKSNNTRRGAPEIWSNPMAPSVRPKQIEKTVLGMSSPLRPTKVAKARSINAKISGGPKDRAKPAKSGAKRVNRMFATVPPTKDASAAVTNAKLALPCCASGFPSKVVATAVDAPGIPSVTEEIAPPYIAP